MASSPNTKRAEVMKLLEDAGYIVEDAASRGDRDFKLCAVSREPLKPRTLYDTGRRVGRMKEQRELKGARIEVIGAASRPELLWRVRLQPSLVLGSALIGVVVLALATWGIVEVGRTWRSVSDGSGNWFDFRPGLCAALPALLGVAVLASWLNGTAREISQMRRTIEQLKVRVK